VESEDTTTLQSKDTSVPSSPPAQTISCPRAP
jgi:hypothetical protein